MKTRPRGYLLMEVLIAGVIASVAVFGLLGQLGSGLSASTLAARELTAQGIVAREVERVRQLGYLGVSPSAATTVSDVKGNYVRELLVTNGNEVLFNTTSTNFRDVVVRVTLTATNEKSEARVRLYE